MLGEGVSIAEQAGGPPRRGTGGPQLAAVGNSHKVASPGAAREYSYSEPRAAFWLSAASAISSLNGAAPSSKPSMRLTPGNKAALRVLANCNSTRSARGHGAAAGVVPEGSEQGAVAQLHRARWPTARIRRSSTDAEPAVSSAARGAGPATPRFPRRHAGRSASAPRPEFECSAMEVDRRPSACTRPQQVQRHACGASTTAIRQPARARGSQHGRRREQRSCAASAKEDAPRRSAARTSARASASSRCLP